MALNLKDVIENAIERNAPDLATAGSTEEISQLAPKIAREIESRYDAHKDKFSYRAVIVILGAVVVIVTITYAMYTMTPVRSGLRDVPDALIALGSAAIGALAGLLAPAPRGA